MEEWEKKLHKAIKNTEHEWGKHPNSQKAIKKHQLKKGTSGNIKGKKQTFSSCKESLKKIGDEHVEDWMNEISCTRKELVLTRIWDGAQGGDIKKIELLVWAGCFD